MLQVTRNINEMCFKTLKNSNKDVIILMWFLHFLCCLKLIVKFK